MDIPLTLHHLAPSPHNIKVRIALAFKGIPYRDRPVDPANRSTLLRLSGQPLAPVIEHGDHTLFDSAAILRYLESNFRDRPPLFSTDVNELKQIEQWDRHHWSQIGPPLGRAFGVFHSEASQPEVLEHASAAMNERSEKLERHLTDHEWLVGDRMSAADIVNGCFLLFACFTETQAAAHPMWAWFREHFHLGADRERCRALAMRVSSYLSESAP